MTKDEIEICDKLKQKYAGAKCELEFKNSFELLIAVILSAQCTDKRVNLVTGELFKTLKTPQDFIDVSLEELEQKIKSCGLYHNKAKNIKSACEDIVAKFGGEVPNNRENLQSLSGVGEKVASVVLATAFKIPAIAVDTHVLRVSNRLGFVQNEKNPHIVARKLMKKIPRDFWIDFHYALVLHGRYVCKAVNPDCENCFLNKNCKMYKHKKGNKNV